MSKVLRFFIVSSVVFLAVYLGAIVGIRMALNLVPKFIPNRGDYVYSYGIIEASDLEFSDGTKTLPDYQVQPSIDVRKANNVHLN